VLSTSPVRRLGVLGGSFDPVHVAHLLVAETVREALGLDLVLFLPAGRQPLKRHRQATPAEHRVAMVELAIRDNPRFALSRIDVDRRGVSYTAETVHVLRRDWGGDAISMWFIIGADSLASFPQWHEPEAVLACTRLAVVRRPGVQLNLASLYSQLPQLQNTLDWIDTASMDISATDIRRRVAEGLSIRYRVPESVRKYIEAQGLYRS
jgi:nicotinate-nucleotide adenylyltransferase